MNRIGKKWKILLFIVLIFMFLWLVVIHPLRVLRHNEEVLEEAARRYFELNPGQLPTGERVKTLSLLDLYHQSYLKTDLYIPYTRKTCSVNNSWVKVRKEENEYQYYTYLKCGILSSFTDHKGPEIKLNGKKQIQVNMNEDFVDPGVKSVVDRSDGTMDVSSVSITSNVDTSKVGIYSVTYTALDQWNNKSVVRREVQVIQPLSNTVKFLLNGDIYFTGEPENNYIRLSGMLFRIYEIDPNDNIVVVADEDVSNVNYTKLEEWLKYYYNHLNDMTKKMIVEKTYCNDSLTEDQLDSTTCTSYSKKVKITVPSIMDINRVQEENDNFMKPYTLSWTSNRKNKSNAYVTRKAFYGKNFGKSYVAYGVNDNYGIRPMFTIKGDSLIVGGDGTIEDPYVFGDLRQAKAGSLVNERSTGEYISIDGELYRIVETEKDGTTRIISDFTVASYGGDVECSASADKEVITYDPKDPGSVAYFINNQVSAYVNTKYFVNHEIKVPVYKKRIVYGEEVETKKYTVKLSAPNMYEMFAAQPRRESTSLSYWLVNSSKAKRTTGLIYTMGVPINEEIPAFEKANIRIVAYLGKKTTIVNGKGTYESPYKIK